LSKTEFGFYSNDKELLYFNGNTSKVSLMNNLLVFQCYSKNQKIEWGCSLFEQPHSIYLNHLNQ